MKNYLTRTTKKSPEKQRQVVPDQRQQLNDTMQQLNQYDDSSELNAKQPVNDSTLQPNVVNESTLQPNVTQSLQTDQADESSSYFLVEPTSESQIEVI